MSRNQTDETEDGADPKQFFDRRRRHRRPAAAGTSRGPGRKAMQLCGQVRDALVGILAGCGDGVVRGLTVVAVEPAPHTGRLLVTVAGPRPADATDLTVAETHLRAAAGWVRREVAASVHRRKAPELAFRVM